MQKEEYEMQESDESDGEQKMETFISLSDHSIKKVNRELNWNFVMAELERDDD